MRSSAFTILIFALFALLSTVYAAPVVEQGALNKRYCVGSDCRIAEVAPQPQAAAAQDPFLNMIDAVLAALEGYKASAASPAPPSTTPTPTSSSSPTPPPTGVPETTPTSVKWFTEVVVPVAPSAGAEV
ncbi:hypothetical protein BC834DRAFT_692010 [Gloeopeniophorella convolvens]|nr:hypothetical protein BC834DRAFT_692010 [Gloeopeniophorella convolvens]